MSQFRDLETMIEILGHTIARFEAEEQFFRRSAQASTSEVAQALFNELADDMKNYIDNLAQRRLKLLDALETLSVAGKE